MKLTPSLTLPKDGPTLPWPGDPVTPPAPQPAPGPVPDDALVSSGGVQIYASPVDGHQVSADKLQQVLDGISELPTEDQQLVRQYNISVEVLPVKALEDGHIGATSVTGPTTSGPWTPTHIRIAADHTFSNPLSEVVQHEVGHVMSVLHFQDLSEKAADHYADTH